ncbi:MAG: hypothetical protein HYY84_20645 [Deltaproteobacteria bacterium]|nr:hypothetical protein [Deltaproteobacteria bacterium]
MTKTNQKNASKLEAVRNHAMEIPADNVREPNMPVDAYVGEVQGTLSAARIHWARFVAIGFAERWLRQAEDGAAALSEAQAGWLATRDRGRSHAEKALIETCFSTRDDLLATCGYVFRNNESARTKIAAIREGEGIYDCAQDLKDVSALIETDRAAFDAIGFDWDKVASARAMSDEVLKVHATESVAKTLDEAKALRDRVYTWTNLAVDEIRAAGLYVLRNENRPDWLAQFRSRYALANKRRNRLKKAVAPGATTAATTAPVTASTPNR